MNELTTTQPPPKTRFASQLQEIVNRTPESRQTLLFSATLPKRVAEFTRAGLKDPELIRLDTETRVSESLALAFFRMRCVLARWSAFVVRALTREGD